MTRSSKFTRSLLAAVLVACGATAQAADKVTVQLKWLPQAQFAGYYVAQSKGYYTAEGLDVTTKPGGPAHSLPLHEAVCIAIEQGNADAAERATLVLIDGAEEDLRELIPARQSVARAVPLPSSAAPVEPAPAA